MTQKLKNNYDYNSTEPINISLDELTDKERNLLTESKTFCMYPWIHLHAYPTGPAYLCCMAEMDSPVGNCREKTLKEIWNDEPMKTVRRKMLNNETVADCAKCYERENHGFFSVRQSANKHHGHHIKKINATDKTGHLDDFEMVYWDIRFSNLCNLRCRSCGHIFSSQWHSDQKKVVLSSYWNSVRDSSWPQNPPSTVEEFNNLPEPIRKELTTKFNGEMLTHIESVKKLPVLTYAGRTKTDMWEQLIPHLDHVEQIYFAGGEPLMMEEHYNILDELERRGRFDVRLIYNTNFTHVKLKDRTVFDYWRKFESVAVGASLDDQYNRAEYIRKGTSWHQVIANRVEMIRTCPNVDFYISPTLSIMNALSLPDFHRQWVETGLIRPQDLNLNIVQDPAYLRVDIAPPAYKERINAKYHEHLDWLRPLDPLNRATVGFESAINFMHATDNTQLIPKFWSKTTQLDQIRKENILDVIPELRDLK
jgi:organic radical activating enzyme